MSGRLQAWAGYLAHRLGLWGGAGLVLCALALGLFALAASWRAQAVEDTAQAERLRRALTRAPDVPRAAPAGPSSFVAQLPGEDDAPQFIETLHREAARAGVLIERAEYRAPSLAGGQLRRTEVVLPVQGRYAEVARWLSAVLYEHPSAALDQLSLQRDAAGGPRLQARVVLSHYSRSAR
jgi:predicted membrane metal-binding protein